MRTFALTVLFALPIAAAMGQPPAGATRTTCAIVRPWTGKYGELLAPRAASAAYQGLETRWSIDTTRATRDLTSFLIKKPQLVGMMWGAATKCANGRCVCPKPPKLAQTAQTGALLSLDDYYRADSNGAAEATALFLARHPMILSQVKQSLERGTTTRTLVKAGADSGIAIATRKP
jgi:hypothetical protein